MFIINFDYIIGLNTIKIFNNIDNTYNLTHVSAKLFTIDALS